MSDEHLSPQGDGPQMVPSAAALPAMPLLEHLRELRRRLMISVGALVLGVILGLPFSQRVIEGLKAMCVACAKDGEGKPLFIITDPLEAFTILIRVGLILGLAVTMPVILYQIVAFIIPALYRRERRYLLLLLPGAAVLFTAGMAFGYFIVLPRTIDFLVSLAFGVGSPMLRISDYIAFVTNVLFILGLAFQTPLVVFSLAKIGILKPQTMSRYRRHAVMVIAILAAVLTPTPDPYTMLMVMGPMYLLYELGGLLARIF